jgi:hypothetical protein
MAGYTAAYEGGDIADVTADLLVGALSNTYTFVAIIGLTVSLVVILYLYKRATGKALKV